ncbi:MAG: DUF1566 domain-containing protein [Patescibacteria group bacterium]|nr:DUF1566 domain-containing protein [Patescibacteria group bacterium]
MKIKGGLADKRGFSMIEILVVISIIGIISVVATVYVRKSFNQARDSQRLNDIRQLQNALERYANDNNEAGYPEAQELIPGKPLISKDGVETYMKAIPSNPKPRTEGTGGCGDKEYKYTKTANGKSYVIQYCLVQGVSNIPGGDCVAMPTITCVPGIEGGCKCNEISKPCCGYCGEGSTCGGGVLFAKNYRIGGANGSNFDLITPQHPCNFAGNDCSSDFDGAQNRQRWGDLGLVTSANSTNDGSKNTDTLISLNGISAAKDCSNLAHKDFMDWYLPSSEELRLFLTKANDNIGGLRGGISGSPSYWSSTEDSSNQAFVVTFNGSNPVTSRVDKTNTNFVRCIRK